MLSVASPLDGLSEVLSEAVRAHKQDWPEGNQARLGGIGLLKSCHAIVGVESARCSTVRWGMHMKELVS